MNVPLTLIEKKGEDRIDTRLLAEQLQNQHRPVVALVDKYRSKFEQFGKVLFEKAPSPGSRTGQMERYALLNEDQCYFLLSLSRNTAHVVDLKANLVRAFKESRAGREAVAIEYLPGYHQLHGRAHDLASGSANEKFVHMNLNKLVNKTVGAVSGQRSIVPLPVRSMTVVAQTIALHAMDGAKDHHDGYEKAKHALHQFGQALKVGAT